MKKILAYTHRLLISKSIDLLGSGDFMFEG